MAEERIEKLILGEEKKGFTFRYLWPLMEWNQLKYPMHQNLCYTVLFFVLIIIIAFTCIGCASALLVSKVLSIHIARLHTRRNVTTCLPGFWCWWELLAGNLEQRITKYKAELLEILTCRKHPE